MHPAPSLIIFTTLSGLGFGLLAWLGFGLTAPTGFAAIVFFRAGLWAGGDWPDRRRLPPWPPRTRAFGIHAMAVKLAVARGGFVRRDAGGDGPSCRRVGILEHPFARAGLAGRRAVAGHDLGHRHDLRANPRRAALAPLVYPAGVPAGRAGRRRAFGRQADGCAMANAGAIHRHGRALGRGRPALCVLGQRCGHGDRLGQTGQGAPAGAPPIPAATTCCAKWCISWAANTRTSCG